MSMRDVSSQLWTLQGCWERIVELELEADRLRGMIERLEIEKHDLAEKLASRDGAR